MKIIVCKTVSIYCSDEDFNYLNQFSWCNNGNGYICRDTREGRIYMHQVVATRMGLVLADGETPDHKDRDRSNNQRDNLRPATSSQQKANTLKKKDCRSRFKGVSWNRDRWQANITLNDIKIYLGKYKTEEEAARAYDRSALRNFGEFAVLNFPGESDGT